MNDVQRDDIGRSTAKARCIGPMEPDDMGTFDFDELFWDDRDVVKYIRLTGVTIEFTNGTSKTFNGRKQIDAHRLENSGVVL